MFGCRRLYLISQRRFMSTFSGMKVDVIQEGTGPLPKKGDKVVVHYTGKLTNGKVFDSSVSRGTPFQFTIGAGMVIRLWDEGIAQLNVGSKATLTGDYTYCYGEKGYPGVIPPKATLIFDVELLGIN